MFSNVELSPALDISRFASYEALADIDEFSTSETATVNLTGINGDGGNNWNYYTDGTPLSDTVTKTMSYDNNLEKWKSTNIYPDSIYPEILFAPSSITWNNTPQNMIVRRNNYQLMHFNNAFTPTANMTFWVEVNAYRKSPANSANLDVYLVEKGHDLTYFQSDWRAKPGIELVGSISKDADFNHTHTSNSSHHLVALSANSDSTIGTKNLNISNDFWIVLYSQSPNDNRGFDLRYHPSAICNNDSSWYSGSQSGWTTVAQTGCPDAHIHLARRSSDGGIRDGVKLVTTATNNGDTGTKTTNLYYNDLPNLAPNTTSFINPTIGGTYSGTINISWNPASDPNNDVLAYTLYLLDENNQQVGDTLLSDSSSTTFDLQTTIEGQEIPNGNYSLKGTACDQGVPSNDPPDAPLCTDFFLPGTFNIDNNTPIRSINSITISSDNAKPSYAKANNTVTLNFTASGSLDTPTVNLFSDGTTPINNTNLTSADNINWTASYLVSTQANSGEVSFEITSTHLDKNYYETTDNSRVIVDVDAPSAVSLSPENGSDKILTDSNLTINFGETVEAINEKNLVIKKYTGDAAVETIDLTSEIVNVDDSTVTIDPLVDLEDKTQYYILIDSGSFIDNAGNEFSGIADSKEWAFTVGDIASPELSTVNASSNNSNPSFAVVGDIVTVLIEANETIAVPTFIIKSNGDTITNSPVATNTSNNIWTAVFTVAPEDSDGLITFSINYTDIAGNLGSEVTETTNGSSITITSTEVPSVTTTSTKTPSISPTTSSPVATAIPAQSVSTSVIPPSPTDTVVPPISKTNTLVAAATETVEYGLVEDLYDIQIKITDNNRPLAGIVTELYSSVRKEVTNVDGIVKFVNVEAGIHKLKIFNGSNIIEKEIAISGEAKQIDINVDINNSRNWLLRCFITGIAIMIILATGLIVSKRIKAT